MGFEKPCDVSDSTIEIVQFCPTSEQTFKDAAEKKNCAAIPNKCESFVYHCVRNRQKNALIEVCAPWLYIVGKNQIVLHFPKNKFLGKMEGRQKVYIIKTLFHSKYHSCQLWIKSDIADQFGIKRLS